VVRTGFYDDFHAPRPPKRYLGAKLVPLVRDPDFIRLIAVKAILFGLAAPVLFGHSSGTDVIRNIA